MTDLMERALMEIKKLPEQEQDALAAWILEELSSEQRWMDAFSASHDMLAELADEALAEHRAGRTQPLDLLSRL
ncbi:MAG: hypothetical protein GYB65_12010 [Chloroflexi bacterium]|nr:hypothetical protein [Chloroflexota bacterium]